MKATETKFLDFLKGPKQFIIPIYQRTYSWTLKQCGQLWHDIVAAATDETVTGHFVGSVVYIEKGLYQISSVPQLLVIDGQQRLTTTKSSLFADDLRDRESAKIQCGEAHFKALAVGENAATFRTATRLEDVLNS